MCVTARTIVLACACAILALPGCEKNASREAVLTGYQASARTDESRATLTRNGDNDFTVTCKNAPASIAQQKNPAWCWAACAETLLNSTGARAPGGAPWSQDELIRMFAHHNTNQAAEREGVLLALAPELRDEYLRARQRADTVYNERATANNVNLQFNEHMPDFPGVGALVDEMSMGRPAIVAVDGASNSGGHVMLAYGVRYSIAEVSGLTRRIPYRVTEIMVLDPWDATTKTLTAEADRVSVAASRELAVAWTQERINGLHHAQWESTENSSNNSGSFNLGNWIKNRF